MRLRGKQKMKTWHKTLGLLVLLATAIITGIFSYLEAIAMMAMLFLADTWIWWMLLHRPKSPKWSLSRSRSLTIRQ